MRIKLKQSSFVSLMAVIVAGAVGPAISVSLLLLGTDRLKSSQSAAGARQAETAADACAEIALGELKASASWSGGESHTLERGECEILPVINAGSQTPTVRVIGSNQGSIRRFEIEISQITPRIIIQSWQEKDSF